MNIKKINEDPTIADKIVFDILTPDADGCFLSDPYKIQTITIYFAERDFNNKNFNEYTKKTNNAATLEQYEIAKKDACISPTEENLLKVSKLSEELLASSTNETFYYKQARAVATFGNEDTPVWISTEPDESILIHVTEDEDENTIYGHFQLEWIPKGVREGDYFICWTWYPLLAGNALIFHEHFTLHGNTQVTTSLPTHATVPEKYETLLERYLPEQFKNKISDTDLSPEVLSELNKSFAKTFTFIEDLGNQVVDLIDSNSTHDNFLTPLGNLFNLKLKSSDATLWRRQIKRAVPLFKKKGTINGLQESFAQAGMKFLGLTRLWQVISPYTWQELINITENNQTEFVLSKSMILPVDVDNFELYYREAESDDWVELTSDYVDFYESSGFVIMSWIGDQLSVDPITLSIDDSIRIVYQINEIPGLTEQDIETYIRTLPLADQRDERDQDYPIKNWNVRLIEEDDILFDVIIANRHPYFDPVIFGKIRTEFPYSENIYNMEEYNGSTRDSMLPCDIDKNFIDSCQFCQSSKFTIDIEIEDLSNDRILEAQEIIEESVPFDAQIHTLNINGAVNEFVNSPEEEIEMLVSVQGEEYTISGNAQMIFNRAMKDGKTTNAITRDILADANIMISGASGTAYNTALTVFSPDVKFSNLPIDESNNIIEILSPHDNAGEYSVLNAYRNTVEIQGVSETPDIVTTDSFTFNLSNILYEASATQIIQDDYFNLSDEELNFSNLGVKSDFSVDHAPDYSGGPWKIQIGSDIFTIKNVLPDDSLILNDPTEILPKTNTSSINYTLLDDNDNVVQISTTGYLSVERRGRVNLTIDLSGDSIDNIRNISKIGNYLLYDGNQYKIIGFVDDEDYQLYITGYTDGGVSGQSTKIYRRLVDSQIGYLNYKGLKLNTLVDQESALEILNGENPPLSEDDILENNSFKENFLVKIGTDYYLITNIDGTEITLNGLPQDWKTLLSGGTSITYDIYKFDKLGATIFERDYPPMSGHSFEPSGDDIPNIEEFLDRRGNEVVDIVSETAVSMMALLLNNNNNDDNGITELVSQNETISLKIEWKNGDEADVNIE